MCLSLQFHRDFSKFANFYRDEQGHFDSVEILNVADPAARASGLLSGSLDAIGSPDVNTATRMNRASGYELVQVSGTQHYTTDMRTDTGPLTDPNVRNAVKWALKRQEIVDNVLGGFATVGNDIPLARNQQFYNDQLPQREYDPEKAKWYLKQSGLDSVDLTFHTSDGAFAGAVDMGVLMQESMRNAGINDMGPGHSVAWHHVRPELITPRFSSTHHPPRAAHHRDPAETRRLRENQRSAVGIRARATRSSQARRCPSGARNQGVPHPSRRGVDVGWPPPSEGHRPGDEQELSYDRSYSDFTPSLPPRARNRRHALRSPGGRPRQRPSRSSWCLDGCVDVRSPGLSAECRLSDRPRQFHRHSADDSRDGDGGRRRGGGPRGRKTLDDGRQHVGHGG